MATESWRGHVAFLRPASRGRRSAPERSAKTVSFSTFSCLSATPELPRTLACSHAMQCNARTHGLPLRAGEDERVLRDHTPSDGVHPRRRLPVRPCTPPLPFSPVSGSGGGASSALVRACIRGLPAGAKRTQGGLADARGRHSGDPLTQPRRLWGCTCRASFSPPWYLGGDPLFLLPVAPGGAARTTTSLRLRRCRRWRMWCSSRSTTGGRRLAAHTYSESVIARARWVLRSAPAGSRGVQGGARLYVA